MSTYKVVFTIKQAIHPLSEIVSANSVDQATTIVKSLINEHKLSLKQIVSVIEL